MLSMFKNTLASKLTGETLRDLGRKKTAPRPYLAPFTCNLQPVIAMKKNILDLP